MVELARRTAEPHRSCGGTMLVEALESVAGATGNGTNSVTLPTAAVQPAGMLFNLGDLNDVLSIQSTTNAISVKGGDGNDTIDVGKFGGSTLGAVQAPVTVEGELGTDTLRINNPAAASPDIYTITGSLAGIPCMSVPCGKTASGLPVGMQILTRHFDEAGMFRLADAFERASN